LTKIHLSYINFLLFLVWIYLR